MDSTTSLKDLNNLEGKYKEFYDFHGVQLIGIKYPSSVPMIKALYDKLDKQIYDAGEYFQIIENYQEEQYDVLVKKQINPENGVFIIDHAFTFRSRELQQNLLENEQLRQRLLSMLKFCDKKKKIPMLQNQAVESEASKKFQEFCAEFDEQNIENPLTLQITPSCITLSLFDNKINSLDFISQLCEKLKNLKVLWLNNNPVSDQHSQNDLFNLIETKFKNIELLNSKFTKNAGEWAFRYVNFSGDFIKINSKEEISENLKKLNLSFRNIMRVENLVEFQKFKKVKILDISEHSLEQIQENINKFLEILTRFSNLKDIICDNDVEDFLWKLHKENKLQQICKRLNFINGYGLDYPQPTEIEKEVIQIQKNIWKIINTYRLADSEKLDETSIWYLMDEFGVSIPHSDQPNLVMAPFLYAPQNKMDDKVISFSCKMQEKTDKMKQKLQEFQEIDLKEKLEQSKISSNPNKNKKFKVITDNDAIRNNVNLEQFEFISDLNTCDILWFNSNLSEKFTEFKHKLLNQFPYESCIVSKANLYQTIVNSLGKTNWVPLTFDLDKELDVFMGEYYTRQLKEKDNFWIIKPPNMARSIDMVVTQNLDQILRSTETGPKLAQKYITSPVTIDNKKIDLRFIVILKSLNPLKLYFYGHFWIRLSNNLFSLDPRSLTKYETHFTVMNYGAQPLQKLLDVDFIKKFNEQYSQYNVEWSSVYEKIKQLTKELFIAVKDQYPQMHNVNSRSIYGMDVMIDKKGGFQPKILEMTFQPDCERACKYYPSFFNEIFSCLFLDTNTENIVEIN